MVLLEYYGSLEAVLVRLIGSDWEARRVGVSNNWWNKLSDVEQQKHKQACDKLGVSLEPNSWVPENRVSIIMESWAVDQHDKKPTKRQGPPTFGSKGG